MSGGATDPRTDGPTHLTILPTYRCTAACEQCCFESDPRIPGRIPIERMLDYIDRAAEEFPTLRLVVFSGGECFLLRQELDLAIARATSHKLATRCVTNGYWATSKRAARIRLGPLYEAGLTELNFSTGDDHQRFVPFDRIVHGAIATAEHGMHSLIVIEGFREARFTMERALAHPQLADFLKTSSARDKLGLINNVWIPFHDDRTITQADEVYRRQDRVARYQGCDNVLENVVITPHEQLASCCGLTFEHIPEMKLGSLRDNRMRDLYDGQLNDFIKIWLRVDGPERIFQFAMQKDPAIRYPDDAMHPCQTCAGLFLDQRVRRTLEKHYLEMVPEVMFRYRTMRTLERRSDPSFAPGRAGAVKRLGFGA